MKKIFYLLVIILFCFTYNAVEAQILKKVLGGETSSASNLSGNEIAEGLKEALSKGAELASNKLSATDGFFKNAALKILLPEEAKQVEQRLRAVGLGKQVDDAILAVNRAAEDAARSAAPIFVNAVKEMSIQDAAGILQGGDRAATNYLQDKTTTSLTSSFTPVIEESLKKVDATKYWNLVFTSYNKFTTKPINPDLTAYVTEKALSGIFQQVAEEEKEIRKNPLARSSDLLKKVFAN